MDILKYIKATSFARPSEKPKSTVQPSPTLEKRDDITPIESRLIPMRARVGRPAQVTSLSSHSSIPGPASLLPNSPTKDIIYGSEKLTESIKVYDAMKRNKIYAKDCSYQHLEKILKENTAGFSQEEYLKALLCHDIPDSVRPFNLFFRLMQANCHVSLTIRDIWLDWLSQPTDPVYKSLLSQVIRIKDPSSKKSLLEWSGNTDIPKARNIKYWIEKVLPDETFKNLPEESETASSMTSVPHHQINPRKRRRNHHQIGLRDEQKKHQKKSMLPVTLPAYLPEDYGCSPTHGHQPTKETPELLPQNPENPGSATTSFTSENIDNVLNFIPFSQTSPVTQVSQSVTEPAVLADTETNSQERKPAQTLTISSSHRQDRFHCDFTGCHKHFKHKQSLSRHKKIHTNEKFRCDAQGCDKEFRQKKYLETHQSNSHQKKRFCCNVTGCDRQFTVKWNLKKHQMNKHKNPDSLSTQTSSSRPINQNSAPASTVGTIIEPAIPVICITGFEEDRHSQVFPDIPAEHSVHDFLTVSDAKALPITLNDPHSGTGMGTRLPPYSLWQWQQNLIKVRQLSDGKIMTAAQNCAKVVDKLIEGSYSGVFTQADPAPASGLEYSSDIKIIYLNNNKYAALDGSTLTLTEQGINKYMQIPVVKKEGSVPCFNANFEEDKFKGTYIEVKQLKPTMKILAQQYGGWVLAVAALSPLVKLTGKKRTATLSDFKNYGHVCLIQYDGASFIIIDPQLTRQEDINECVESDINNIYRFFDPKSPAKSAEFNDHITLTVVNSSVDMRRKSKTESVPDGGSTQASPSTSLGPPL